MGVDFAHRIKALRAEVEALKTASRSDSDGMNTVTKTINMTARMVVYAAYVEGIYFIKLTPASSDDRLVFSVSQKHAAVSDDVIVSEAVPKFKNGEIGVRVFFSINYQRQQWYLENYNEGDIIEKPVSVKITASDDFSYTIAEDN